MPPVPWSGWVSLQFVYRTASPLVQVNVKTLSRSVSPIHNAPPYPPKLEKTHCCSPALRMVAKCPPMLTASASALLHVFLDRSEEHTSELQSLRHLVCRL